MRIFEKSEKKFWKSLKARRDHGPMRRYFNYIMFIIFFSEKVRTFSENDIFPNFIYNERKGVLL